MPCFLVKNPKDPCLFNHFMMFLSRNQKQKRHVYIDKTWGNNNNYVANDRFHLWINQKKVYVALPHRANLKLIRNLLVNIFQLTQSQLIGTEMVIAV